MSNVPPEMMPDEPKFVGSLPDCPECGEPVNRGKHIDGELYHTGEKGCWFEAKAKFKRFTPMPCPNCGHPTKDESNRHYTPWYDVKSNHYTCDRCSEAFYAPSVFEKFGYTRLPRDHPAVVDCPECDDVMTMVRDDSVVCLKCGTKVQLEDN